VIQSTFDMMKRIGSVILSRGDRRFAESVALDAERAVDLLCRAGVVIRSALALAGKALAHRSSRGAQT
jgi:hypothetical protein